MVAFTFGMLLQSRFNDVGASVLVISLISTINGGVSSVASAVWGAISDEKEKRRGMLTLVVALAACVYPLFAVTDNQVILLMFVALLAFFKMGYPPISMALSSEYSEGEIKSTSRELSFLNTANSIGMLIGRVSLSIFFLFNTSKTAIILFSIIAWGPVITSLFIKEGNRVYKKKKKTTFIKRIFPIASDFSPLKKNGLWAIYLGSFLRQFGINGTMAAILVFMTDDLLLSYSLAVLLSSLNPFMQMFSHILSGKFIGRVGSKISTISGISISSLAPLSFLFADNWMMMAVGYLFLGLGFGAFINGASTFISINGPSERRAEFMGLLTSMRAFGAMLGPVVSGLIANQSFRYMFVFMVVVMLSGAMTVFFFSHEKRPVAEGS